MRVPDGHMITVYSINTTPNSGTSTNTYTESKTEVKVSNDATVADVIEAALDNFSITAGPEHYDLWEVTNQSGHYPIDPELIQKDSRTLSYAEHPVKVTREWYDDVFHGESNGVNGDNNTLKVIEPIEAIEPLKINKCRLYLVQKSCALQYNCELQITWYEGLKKNIRPDQWHFEPYYREHGEIDDLINLNILTENVMLDELCVRFGRGRIYTYVGGILIAINPFKYFPLYNPKYIKAYQRRKFSDLPPHIFAIADAAYTRMLQDKHDQCIVISGESGSGKTESTKLILHHLTALSHKTKATLLEKTILHAGPVLEAFGNAKTCHNDNSSRFGKFTQINYRADGVVCGAVLKIYLLEKSRIVSQAVNERNYHVFYYLLAGASTVERETLHLDSIEKYHYLNQTKCYSIDGIDEVYEFSRLKSSIKNIGLQNSIQHRMFAVLSAVLLIGNITFKKRCLTTDDVSVIIADTTILDTISKLLQVEKEELILPLTMRRTVTRGEEFTRFYKSGEAITTRDSMAKCLYASLFDWIVLQTNHIMVNRQGRNPENKKEFSIGVLDIFGFEDFEVNSFEQFCINLANENLQYYLNQHIFKMIQDEYTSEGINWNHVDYVDNINCLNLIVGRPTGLILLLDEECSLTMGTDDSLLDKFNKHHALNQYYEMPPTRKPVFSIVHYAGQVKYLIKGFRTKNHDLMRSDIVAAFKNSRMLFVRELMGSDPMAIYYWSVLRHVIKAIALFKKAGAARSRGEKMFDEKPKVAWGVARTPPPNRTKMIRQLTAESDTRNQATLIKAGKVMKRSRRIQELTRIMQSPNKVRSGLSLKRALSGGMNELSRRGGLKSPPTVVAQFQTSLQELMETLNNSHPFFVRCVRSNSEKLPLNFDTELVQRQLRYTGMLETVKIRQRGYPCRLLIKDFVLQFKLLWQSQLTVPTTEDISNSLLNLGIDPDHFQIGKTKIYMQARQYTLLRNKLQEKINYHAKIIQRWFRTFLVRKQFLRIRVAVVQIQAVYRGHRCRKEYRKLLIKHHAATCIQTYWRESNQKKFVFKEREFDKFKKSIIHLQSAWRGCSARKRYTKMLVEKREAEEHKKIQKDAESMVNEAIRDTIFTKENVSTDGLENENELQLPSNDKVLHHDYEEIDDIAVVFNTTPNTTINIPEPHPVKLRSHSGLSTDRTPENMRQKLIRRLSFTAKDKQKYSSHIKKAKEAEDDGFVHVPPPVEDFKRSAPVTHKNSVVINLPPQAKTTFAGFLSVLQRKGSRRDLTKGDKKGNRRHSAVIDDNNEYIINGEAELEAINLFLMKKVTEMNRADYATGPDVDVDLLFKNALHKYHGNLLFTCGHNVQRQEPVAYKFHDLVNGFQNVLDPMVSKEENVSPEFSVIGGNLFRGIIQEFQKNKDKLVLKRRPRRPIKKKRRKTVEYYEYKGHIYNWQSFNINTYCEYCNTFIYDKGLECQACSFACHKKCYHKYNNSCKGRRPSVCGPAALYGTDLSEITSPNNPIPEAIIKIMIEIERRGLHTEGLYRKPGLQAAVNTLKSLITSTDAEDLLFEDERPQTLSSALKLFFRQLPKPLICQEFDDDFIRSTDLGTEEEMHSTMYELIQRFPKANKELLERIIIHLSRVAMMEDSNKMSPNALAIIWAPVLMRAPGEFDTLDCLLRLPKQTKCIEVLIESQVKKMHDSRNDIVELEAATYICENRLHDIQKERTSVKHETTDGIKRMSTGNDEFNEEIQILENEISSMAEERRRLTNGLANMAPHKRGSMDSLDELGSETDNEIIRGSDDEVNERTIRGKKCNSKIFREKFAEVQFSSFEDLDFPDTSEKFTETAH